MHYLDHAASTPLVPEVRDAMLDVLSDNHGNPSSVHSFGRKAREAVEEARERVAGAVGASPSEIFFTAGGTEADNIAIKGAASKRRGSGSHVAVSAFEHHAVLDAASWLSKTGLEVTTIPVEADGIVSLGAVTEATRPSTILVAVMAVNNEIGTIQPIREIVVAAKGASPDVLVHTDAVQALGNIPVDVHRWGVDLAAFSAHKLGGPKGVGALFVRSGVAVEALVHGGGQERGVRSGTLNVAGIVGFGVAAQLAEKEIDSKAERLEGLRAHLLEGLRSEIPDIVVNGTMERRVAGNLNVAIPGTDGETLLLLLDQAGVACSSGAACASGALDPSHVLLAIGTPREVARGSLRFSLGRDSSAEDVDAVVKALPEAVKRARLVS
ncbi:MAG TPA: cysteine desulfurase family protein [Actinomycetota bacterium]|nr:cysteine desulfurase family protein [Actinomycetota bacterium]